MMLKILSWNMAAKTELWEAVISSGADIALFVGPQYPNGRQADPWPAELARASLDVPTFHSETETPATATKQLDYVFASKAIADRVKARALNRPEEWGASNHCRVWIELE